MYLGYQQGKIKFYVAQSFEEPTIEKWEETNEEYALSADGTEYVLKDEAWEEEQAQKEKERIAKLCLTRGDVFRGLLQAKGVTKAQLRAGIEAMPAGLQKEMALIDFDEALNFYRGNTLVDTVGATLGITSEQLDKFFETNDYHELINSEQTEPTENDPNLSTENEDLNNSEGEQENDN